MVPFLTPLPFAVGTNVVLNNFTVLSTSLQFLLVKGKSCSPYYKTLFSGCSFEDPDVKNFLKSNNIGSRFFKLLEEKTGLVCSFTIASEEVYTCRSRAFLL